MNCLYSLFDRKEWFMVTNEKQMKRANITYRPAAADHEYRTWIDRWRVFVTSKLERTLRRVEPPSVRVRETSVFSDQISISRVCSQSCSRVGEGLSV